MKKPLLLLLLLAIVMTAPMEARGKKAVPTTPGTYKEWGPDIDQIEIVKTFKMDDYDTIVVEPFDTESVKLPDKDDNSYDSAVRSLGESADYFAGGLHGLTRAKVYLAGKKPAKGAGTLVIRAKVTLMDPGSRSARYWVGFGAGASRTEIEGEIIDAKSGDVLVRFTQQRRSGVGNYGGDYEDLLQRNLYTIGEDVAHLLREF